MITWQRLVFDLLSPFLIYSIVYSSLFAGSIYTILKILRIDNPKLKSFLYIFPLLVPLVIFILFPPRVTSVFVQFSSHTPSQEAVMNQISIAGLLCLMGLVASTVLLVVLYVFGSRLVCWLQGVVELVPEENPKLRAIAKRLAECAGIAMPRIGLTEDLRPNAFTVGYGKKAMIVFTLGLLDTLDGPELEAVIAHELAHIKNRDFHFNVLTSTLQVISFFNPVAYLLAAAIRREREVLADKTGIRFIKQPATLGLALTKIWEASKDLSRGRLKGWVSGFFISSEIRLTRKFLSKHPPLENRLNKLTTGRFWENPSKNEVLRTLLACVIITVMVLWICRPLIQISQMRFFGLEPSRVYASIPGWRATTLERAKQSTLDHGHNYTQILFMPFKSFPSFNTKSITPIGTVPHLTGGPTGGPAYFIVIAPKPPHPFRMTSILPWIVTTIDIALVAIVLLRVCCNDLKNAINTQKLPFPN